MNGQNRNVRGNVKVNGCRNNQVNGKVNGKVNVRRYVRVSASFKARGMPRDKAEAMVRDAIDALVTEFMGNNWLIHNYDYLEISYTTARCVTYKSVGLRLCFIRGFASHVDCFDRNSKQCVEAWFRVIALESITPLPLYEVLRNFVAKGRRVCAGWFVLPLELRKEEMSAVARAIGREIDVRVDHGHFVVDLNRVEVNRRDHVFGTLKGDYDVSWFNIKFRDLRLRLFKVEGGFCSEDNVFFEGCEWQGFDVYCLQPLGQ